nr:MAG TPA: hypothetical protein [Caudoviricetes sp.]
MFLPDFLVIPLLFLRIAISFSTYSTSYPAFC